MSYDKGVFSSVMERFEKKREQSRSEIEAKRQKIYGLIPRIAEIDKELKKIALDAVKASLLKNGEAEKIIRQYKKKSLNLQGERAELLFEQGYSMDYLKEKYSCKKCEDRGFSGSSMCDCFKKELRKESYSRSNLGANLTEQTFKSFDFTYYSDTVISKLSISPRENIERIYAYAKKYAEKFSLESSNLLLIGKTGLGKTYLSTAIAKTVIDKGFWVIYDTAQNILLKLERNRFGRDGAEDSDISRYFECDLLIIDDLGAEFKTALSEASIYNIINSRIVTKKPMMISTNNDYNELNEIYSERIISRLIGEFVTLFFLGEDIRAKKIAKKASEN